MSLFLGAVQSVHPQKLFGHILVLDSLPLPPMVGVRTADARANEPAKRICLLVHDHRFLKCEPRGMIPRGVDPVVEKHFQREREREREERHLDRTRLLCSGFGRELFWT